MKDRIDLIFESIDKNTLFENVNTLTHEKIKIIANALKNLRYEGFETPEQYQLEKDLHWLHGEMLNKNVSVVNR